MGRMTKSIGKAKDEMADFGRVSGLAFRRFAGFTIATTAIFGFVRAVGSAVGSALSI